MSPCRRGRPHKTRSSREQLGCFKPSGTALPSQGLLPIAAICARPRSACRAAGTPLVAGAAALWMVLCLRILFRHLFALCFRKMFT